MSFAMEPGPPTCLVSSIIGTQAIHLSLMLVSATGLAAGGLWGLREGLTRPIYRSSLGQAAAATGSIALDALGKVQQQAATAAASAAGNSTSQPARPQMRMSAPLRLRLNTVLNAMTSRGTFVGNNAGVLGMCIEGLYIFELVKWAKCGLNSTDI